MAVSQPTNPFQAAARARKAAELVAYARARLCTAEQVATDHTIRSMLVNVTGVNEPSRETWHIVVSSMQALERMDALMAKPGWDPFEGFPGGAA